MNSPRDRAQEQRRIGQAMVWAMWIVVLVVLTAVFNGWLEGQRNPNQSVESYTREGVHEVVLQRNRYGHYVATGAIDSQRVEFMLDTGASDISVPADVAKRLGLRRGAPLQYQTANGVITGYATTLGTVRVGDIVLHNVRASINPYMRDPQVLLGMSFLRQLEFTQRGERLTLRQYPPSR